LVFWVICSLDFIVVICLKGVIVEMVTRQHPYPDLLPHEASGRVGWNGLRPEIPTTTNETTLPPAFIKMFDSCFARAPESRPDFRSICDVLSQLAPQEF
jgi:hypothetical protein